MSNEYYDFLVHEIDDNNNGYGGETSLDSIQEAYEEYRAQGEQEEW